MTTPAFTGSYSPASDWTSTTTPKTQNVTANSGDLIVVLGGTEDFSTTLATPTDSASDIYTLQTSSVISGTCAGYIWTATAGSGGSTPSITTASLPAATDGTAYSATLAAAGGTPPYTWSIAGGALPSWASLAASTGVISGTPSGAGTASFTVQVTDSFNATATKGLSITTSAAAQPVGPGGNWTLVFEDTFNGTSLDTTKWATPNGISNSATVTDSSKVSVSGGSCQILHNGMINSQPSLQGWGSNPSPGVTLSVGQCCEASINFPGSGGSSQYNWPAWWTSGAAWPANGECDITEGYDSSLSALNYHSNSGANNGPHPSGNYVNSFHTYTLVRGSGTNGLKCYWDGVLVRQVTPNDSGGPHSLIVYNAGNGSSGGPLNTSLPIQVDYVRVWSPA